MSQSLVHIPLNWPRDLRATIRSVANGGPCVWLGGRSGASHEHLAGASVVGVAPIGRLQQMGSRADWRLIEREGRDRTETGRDAWAVLKRVHGVLQPGAGLERSTLRYGPGWLGYIGYEMAALLEPAVARAPQTGPPLGLPSLHLLLCDAVIVLDERERHATLIADEAIAARLRGRALRAAAIADAWNAAAGTAPAEPNCGPVPPPSVEFAMSRQQYTAAVARVREYIAAGDIYQANLAQPLRVSPLTDPWEVFDRVRSDNPAAFSALITWEDAAIVSVSPELFLDVRAGRVVTRPIKGTRRRGATPAEDERLVAELLASAKDAAELAMIVDLHRNDLGRVCRPGTVRVDAPRVVEMHPTVIHTVAEISGELAAGRTALDALMAAFPAGSITGVPKIRAMQIIAELEAGGRGAYCGSIGWLGVSGDMTMNVAIRTLQMRGGEGVLHAGGGIVAESDPDLEYAETLAKAASLLRGLGAGV